MQGTTKPLHRPVGREVHFAVDEWTRRSVAIETRSMLWLFRLFRAGRVLGRGPTIEALPPSDLGKAANARNPNVQPHHWDSTQVLVCILLLIQPTATALHRFQPAAREHRPALDPALMPFLLRSPLSRVAPPAELLRRRMPS